MCWSEARLQLMFKWFCFPLRTSGDKNEAAGQGARETRDNWGHEEREKCDRERKSEDHSVSFLFCLVLLFPLPSLSVLFFQRAAAEDGVKPLPALHPKAFPLNISICSPLFCEVDYKYSLSWCPQRREGRTREDIDHWSMDITSNNQYALCVCDRLHFLHRRRAAEQTSVARQLWSGSDRLSGDSHRLGRKQAVSWNPSVRTQRIKRNTWKHTSWCVRQ